MVDSNVLYKKTKRHTVYKQDTYVQSIILFIGQLCGMFTADGSSRQMFCPIIYKYYGGNILSVRCEI